MHVERPECAWNAAGRAAAERRRRAYRRAFPHVKEKCACANTADEQYRA